LERPAGGEGRRGRQRGEGQDAHGVQGTKVSTRVSTSNEKLPRTPSTAMRAIALPSNVIVALTVTGVACVAVIVRSTAPTGYCCAGVSSVRRPGIVKLSAHRSAPLSVIDPESRAGGPPLTVPLAAVVRSSSSSLPFVEPPIR